MSADNFVGVVQIEGVWIVLDNLSASCDYDTIDLRNFPGTHRVFQTREQALVAAHDMTKLNYYEHGVCEL